MGDAPRISVVVPAHNAAGLLTKAIDALVAGTLGRLDFELIVVDDGSDDDAVARAATAADALISLPAPARGPAFARNRGADAARSEIIAFVDSDVCVHVDAVERILGHFDADPDLGAVFGSYDDRPGGGFVSQYRNLLHHYVHQRGAGESESFWAGCGAVRRAPFLAVGKFNEHRYDRPEIEDVELGYRLRDAGFRVVLDPSIQGTHLKRWTFGSMLYSDFHHRGVPWTLLLLQRRRLVGAKGLSVGTGDKASALLVGVLLLVLIGALAQRTMVWLYLVGICAASLLIVNRALIGWFAEERGWWFAARGFVMHVIYHATNVASVIYGTAGYFTGRLGRDARQTSA